MDREISNCNIFYEIKDARLNFLSPVIEEWGRMNKKFSEEINDTFFRLNERPNLGLFSSAIWMCGGVSVEEYSSRKGTKKSSGRVDLRFKYNDIEVICEAKHRWLKVPKSKVKYFDKAISRGLNNTKDNAICDLNHTLAAIDKKPELGLALTFFSPYWSKDTPLPIAQFEKLKSELKNLSCAFVAYIENDNQIPPYVNSQEESFKSMILVGQLA